MEFIIDWICIVRRGNNNTSLNVFYRNLSTTMTLESTPHTLAEVCNLIPDAIKRYQQIKSDDYDKTISPVRTLLFSFGSNNAWPVLKPIIDDKAVIESATVGLKVINNRMWEIDHYLHEDPATNELTRLSSQLMNHTKDYQNCEYLTRLRSCVESFNTDIQSRDAYDEFNVISQLREDYLTVLDEIIAEIEVRLLGLKSKYQLS